jgi:hypothetical protein
MARTRQAAALCHTQRLCDRQSRTPRRTRGQQLPWPVCSHGRDVIAVAFERLVAVHELALAVLPHKSLRCARAAARAPVSRLLPASAHAWLPAGLGTSLLPPARLCSTHAMRHARRVTCAAQPAATTTSPPRLSSQAVSTSHTSSGAWSCTNLAHACGVTRVRRARDQHGHGGMHTGSGSGAGKVCGWLHVRARTHSRAMPLHTSRHTHTRAHTHTPTHAPAQQAAVVEVPHRDAAAVRGQHQPPLLAVEAHRRHAAAVLIGAAVGCARCGRCCWWCCGWCWRSAAAAGAATPGARGAATGASSRPAP